MRVECLGFGSGIFVCVGEEDGSLRDGPLMR
jgi:hypothetical protein